MKNNTWLWLASLLLFPFFFMSDKKILLPQGRIASRFGWRIHPVTGEKHFHNGIDIVMPIGTPIYAPDDGVIRDVYFNNIGGKQLLLDTDNYIFGFAHLSEVFVKKGQRVNKGDLIARSGNTGRTTGAHLHFTVADKKTGKHIDPSILYA